MIYLQTIKKDHQLVAAKIPMPRSAKGSQQWRHSAAQSSLGLGTKRPRQEAPAKLQWQNPSSQVRMLMDDLATRLAHMQPQESRKARPLSRYPRRRSSAMATPETTIRCVEMAPYQETWRGTEARFPFETLQRLVRNQSMPRPKSFQQNKSPKSSLAAQAIHARSQLPRVRQQSQVLRNSRHALMRILLDFDETLIPHQPLTDMPPQQVARTWRCSGGTP